jgi:hypothetical protein
VATGRPRGDAEVENLDAGFYRVLTEPTHYGGAELTTRRVPEAVLTPSTVTSSP